MTVGEQLAAASKTCTAMDIARQLDKLKNEDGFLDQSKLIALINQLNEFGPYYADIIKYMALKLK